MAFKFKNRTIKKENTDQVNNEIKPVSVNMGKKLTFKNTKAESVKPITEPKKVIKKEVINTKHEHHSLDDIILVKKSPFTDDMLTTKNE